MNKICTTIEQSKKLIELGVDIETADMCWTNHLFNAFLSSWRIESTPPQEYKNLLDRFAVRGYLIEPAWSLAALLGLMPKIIKHKTFLTELEPLFIETSALLWHIGYRDIYIAKANNPLDAAFEMVCWLKENGKL